MMQDFLYCIIVYSVRLLGKALLFTQFSTVKAIVFVQVHICAKCIAQCYGVTCKPSITPDIQYMHWGLSNCSSNVNT